MSQHIQHMLLFLTNMELKFVILALNFVFNNTNDDAFLVSRLG